MLRDALTGNGRRRLVLLGTAGLVGHEAAEALVPVVIGAVIDAAIVTGDVAALLLGLSLLLGVFLLLLVSYNLGARGITTAYERADHDLRMRVLGRRLDRRGLAHERPTGEVLSIATNDSYLSAGICWLLSGAASSLAALVVASVALFTISVPLGLLVLLGTPPLLLGMRLLSRPVEQRTAADQAAAANASAVATDLVSGIRVLGGLGARSAAARRHSDASAGSVAAALRSLRWDSTYFGASSLGGGVLLVAVTALAGTEALAGGITIGQFVTVVALAQYLQWPMGSLAYAIGADLAAKRAAAGRIADFLNTPEHAATEDTGAVLRLGALELRCPTDSLLGIVAEPDAARALARSAVGAAILAPPHVPALFADTVRAALASAEPDGVVDVDDARLLAAARTAGLHELLGAGLDRPIGTRGRELSGGQRQRLALGRALVADPAQLVLHDPTTAVDAVTEGGIAAALGAARRGRGTVLITTSPSLLAACDEVVVVLDGAVALRGRHDDLVEHERYRAVVFA